MDKALEVIMVAVILVVASVVIISMLQSQTGNFGNYTNQQTEGSSCGLAELKYERALDCDSVSETTAASNIESANSQCAWADTSTDQAGDYC